MIAVNANRALTAAHLALVDSTDGLDRVRLLRPLVRPVAFESGEPEGEAAGVLRARLHAIKGYFRDKLGAYVNGMGVPSRFEFKQSLRLPFEQLVRQAFEGLSLHTAAGSPLCCTRCRGRRDDEPALLPNREQVAPRDVVEGLPIA